MDFHLTEEQQSLRDRVKDLALTHIAPYAASWDEQEIFPAETIATLGVSWA